MTIYKHETSADTLVVDPYSSKEMFERKLESFLCLFHMLEVQSVHCHIKNSQYVVIHLVPKIFFLEMGIVEDKSLSMVLPYKLLKQ